MKKSLAICFFFISLITYAQLQSPSEFLGYEIGTQFSRHADVVRYFEHVAANSNMVTYHRYGKTNERRLLTYAIVSSPSNLANIEKIRTDNLKQAGIIEGSAAPDIAIVWLSYNVHGNEASSTEAAMVTLYKLITEKKAWLENTVVIIDPCINPDGRDRYANWYNQVKATPYDTNPVAAEHNEPWPGGRPNHYLFDLNRDWAWATQIESQQRIKVYNRWMPHVHVDFHEQGINEPYYFAPAAEPYHEIISPWQRDFQTQIGKNNAKYFDQEGWLFFTRQFFDLLYPSYGDTYPMYMGAIGMTYEQAGHGRAGLGILNDEGIVLTLVDRVAHHTTTGLSTVEIASQNAKKLNTEFHKFFDTGNLTYKSYVMRGNPDNIQKLTHLLDLHEIKYGFANSGTVSGWNYQNNKKGSMDASGALVVSTNQPKGKMVKVLFEPDAKLTEPLTYDITAWSIPYAYGLDCVASTALVNANGTNPNFKIINQVAPTSAVAGYIIPWNSMQDAQFLADLLKQDIRVRFSEKELSIQGKQYPKGSLVITKSDNRNNPNFTEIVTTTANAHGRNLHIAPTSFSDNGTDFGSTDVKLINKNRIAILKGPGVSSLSYGALWHFMEVDLKYPITSIDTGDFSVSDLEKFDVLVLPSGWYQRVFGESTLGELKSWIQQGGKVIAIDNALKTFEGKEGFDLKKHSNETKENEGTPQGNLIPYDQRERASVKDFITGSIYKVTLDPSHPMAFGYGNTYFSLKLGNDSYQFLEEGYNVGYIEGAAESVSGFSGNDAKAGLKNSLVFGEARIGNGSMVYFVDDVLFRSFWENGKLFFVNSLFLVNSNVFVLD
ncbi:MAG TPA: M14 family metallopeptidase [Flavobacteriaceae bacterium]|nr:zinc carboxypeptidase [Flavobacteriaceae bacterium]MCB9212366.1 zinc carboxypeptidase [Alteromonas sp.]HPF11642.1 M14 family metallopeptidase [Flavobacteriaceae bacterium]HQU20117.1 M14 family metallopeptidase [Flavobacteriaceae bacterium]HQU64794.1 M14 family metallopeptidase [Flavobacteriaceae bacterium]